MWDKRHENAPPTQVDDTTGGAVLAPDVPEVPAGGSAADAAKPTATPTSAQPVPETVGSASETTQQSAREARNTKARLFWHTKLRAANFGNMIALLANSPLHKHFSLADLGWAAHAANSA